MKKQTDTFLKPYSSYEKRELLNELREKPLNEKKSVFQIIIYNQEEKQYRELYWNNILDAIYEYYQYNEFNQTHFPKYFYSEQNFKILEEIGINYNYIDRSGFNFLHYFLHAIEDRNNNSNYIFSDMMLDYVLDKTKDVYHLNNSQENILFSMISVALSGIKGERLDSFLSKYPHFNLNQTNVHGINILDKALQHSLIEVATHMIEHYHIDYKHLNSKGGNLLRHFLFLSAEKPTLKLFDFLVEHLDTEHITAKNGLIDTWLSWARKDANVHYSSKNKCIKWISHVMRKANEQSITFNIDSDTIQYLEAQFREHKKEFVSFHKEEFSYIESLFNNSEAYFQKLYLEQSINESNSEKKDSQKLKI